MNNMDPHSIEWEFIMFINMHNRVLRLHSKDWKSSLTSDRECIIYFCFHVNQLCHYSSHLLNRLNLDVHEGLYFNQTNRLASQDHNQKKKVWLRQCQWLNSLLRYLAMFYIPLPKTATKTKTKWPRQQAMALGNITKGVIWNTNKFKNWRWLKGKLCIWIIYNSPRLSPSSESPPGNFHTAFRMCGPIFNYKCKRSEHIYIVTN